MKIRGKNYCLNENFLGGGKEGPNYIIHVTGAMKRHGTVFKSKYSKSFIDCQNLYIFIY